MDLLNIVSYKYPRHIIFICRFPYWPNSMNNNSFLIVCVCVCSLFKDLQQLVSPGNVLLIALRLPFLLLSFICSFHCVFTGIDFFWFHLRPFAWGNCLAVYNTCHDIKKYMRTIAAYYKMLSGFESSGVAEHYNHIHLNPE